MQFSSVLYDMLEKSVGGTYMRKSMQESCIKDAEK